MDVEFIDRSPEVLAALDKQIMAAVMACGLAAESFAKDYLIQQKAVDTGNLLNSITKHSHKDNAFKTEKTRTGVKVTVGSNVHYAVYVELGTGAANYPGGRDTPWPFKDAKGNWHMTSGMQARPYLKPAIANHGDEYMEIVKENLKSGD